MYKQEITKNEVRKMNLNININRKYLIVFIIALVAATVVNYTIAQGGTQSHPYSQIELPASGAVWPNLNADMVDGYNATDLGGGGAFVMVTNGGPSAQPNCELKCGAGNCAFGYTNDGTGYMKWIDDCTNSLWGNQPTHCACWS